MKKLSLFISLLIINLSLFAQAPEDSLQLDLLFNNNCLDQSGNDFHGTVNGASIDADRFGNPSHAYLFDGVDDYIAIPHAPELKPDFPFSISLWVKVDEFSSTSSLLYASDEIYATYSGFWLGYLSNGEVSAGYGNGLGQGPQHRITKHSGISLDQGVWHNIIASFNGLNDIDLYVDCLKDMGYYSGSASSMSNSNSNSTIGRSLGHNATSYHKGEIDDIRLYNRTLSINEIGYFCNETDPILSLSEKQESITSIYPNPTKDFIYWHIETENDNLELNILNLTGQVVKCQKQCSSKGQLNLKDLSTGYYRVQITDSKGQIIKSEGIIIE